MPPNPIRDKIKRIVLYNYFEHASVLLLPCLVIGWLPNVQRAALVNLGDLTAYDQAKTFLVLRGFDADSKVRHQYTSQISYS